MSRYPTKINRAIEMLMEGKSSKDIKEETGCSDPTLTIARKRLAEREGDLVVATADTNNATDEVVDSFINRIKIQPDPEVLTKDKPEEVEDTEYECPKCHHEWSAPKKEHQLECPNCGLEFE